MERNEASVAINQIFSQYSGKTCIGIFHPKKFGFITSDNIKAIITPMVIEKKLTIFVKINTFNSSKRNTWITENPTKYTGSRSFFLNLFILIRFA